jgi:hypothetical protein
VDVAVLEVGLGGRFDATNVVCDAYSSNIKTDVVLQAFMLSTKNAKPRINLKMYAVLIPKKLASLNLDAYFCNHSCIVCYRVAWITSQIVLAVRNIWYRLSYVFVLDFLSSFIITHCIWTIKDQIPLEIYKFGFLQVEAPVVCGISSLGYDHMEILG